MTMTAYLAIAETGTLVYASLAPAGQVANQHTAHAR